MYEQTMKIDAKKGAKSQQQPSKNEIWKMIDFWIEFSESGVDFFVFLRTQFHPNLPSVRKVTCRKTNKKEKKTKSRIGCNAGQDRVHELSQTRPAGPRSRPGADLSCLRQYIRPGPAEKGFCENLRLVGRMRQFRIFCSLDIQKYQKWRRATPKMWKSFAKVT